MSSNDTFDKNDTLDELFTSCPNAVAWRILLSGTQSYIIAISIAVVIVPTLLCNGLLLLGLMKTKQPKSSCTSYIIISAIVGCLNGFTGLPMYVMLFSWYHESRNCIFESLAICVMQINTHILGYSILILAVDRYFSVRPNFGKMCGFVQWFHSKTALRFFTFAILLLSILHGLVSVSFFTNIKSNAGKWTMLVLNVIIAIGVYVTYLKLYQEIRVHENSFRKSLQSGARSYENEGHRSRRTPKYLHEFIKTISIILVAGIICYIPFIAMDFYTGWYTFIRKTTSPPNVRFVYYLSIIPLFLNSSINAILFLYRNDQALNYIRRWLLRTQTCHVPEDCLGMKQFGPHGTLRRMTLRNDSVVETPLSSPALSYKSSPLLKKAIYIIDVSSPQSPRMKSSAITSFN